MTKLSKKYFKPRKPQHWAVWNEKLDEYTIYIDLADIRHLSRKMYETGKISKKVLKKWCKRDYSRKHKAWCGHKGSIRQKCSWLPASVFHKYNHKNYNFEIFHWHCRYCGSETQWVYDDEISQELAEAYTLHTKSHRWE